MQTEFHTPVNLDRDTFMRRLVASLGHLNEGILGSDVAGGYVLNVGLSMGAAIEDEYKRFWHIQRPFTLEEYSHVIVDLKQHIQGNFSLVSSDPEKVVVETTSCPFDEFVRQSPSLCFMTSSVFGGIAARNFGYAKVALQKRIALGDPGCYVTVYLKRTPEAEAAVGKEYYPELDKASPDIAEQLRLMESVRRLRHQLQETSSRWEEVVQAAAEAICLVDGLGQIVFANARWRDLLGVESSELVGHRLERLVHPEEQERVVHGMEGWLRGERTVGHEWRMHHRDGAWREASVSAGPVKDEAGRVLGAMVIARDVTEEREAQRLKDALLSSASHELRTPVATIKGLAEVMLRTLDRDGGTDPQALAARLKVILAEADRLAMLGRDLSDAARLHRAQLRLHKNKTDLGSLVEAALERQKRLPGTTPTHHLVLSRPSDPVLLESDHRRVEQIIANMLENAVKYSPGGGEVSITVERDESAARVTVRDEGIGIPEKDLAHLFSPFFRASNASERNYVGLGLGLYLSREFARALGGDVTVSSREGKGSSFTLVLPV